MSGSVPSADSRGVVLPRGRIRGAARAVRRFVRGVVGSDAYDTYLRHHRITGCTHEPMSEKEFWRHKYAVQDSSPEGRCC